eukprot:32386_1
MSLYDNEFISLSNTVLKGLQTSGFISLMNINKLDTNKLLSISKSFFEKDISYKLNYAKCKWNSSNSNCYRGYYPIIPGQSSMKEAIEYGRDPSYVNNPFPEFSLYENHFNIYPDINNWKQIFTEQYEILLDTATKIMRLISFGLYNNTTDKPINYFEPMFLPYTLSTFRLMHSPSHPLYKHTNENEFHVTSTPDHVDSGFITLVITFNKGLEALNEVDNKWEKLPINNDIDTYGNNFVHMNVGRVLRNMTNERLKATRHRVINYGESRYSIAFFFEPSYDTVIPINEKGDYENYGPWLVEIDKQFIEYSDEKVGLCWYNKTINGLQCVDHLNNPIDYNFDDGLYDQFAEGNL